MLTQEKICEWILHAEAQRDPHRRKSMAALLFQLQRLSQPSEPQPPADNEHVAPGCLKFAVDPRQGGSDHG